MRATVPSDALVGIDALPVLVAVEVDQVKVVETRTLCILHSVRQLVPEGGTLPIGSGVESTWRKRAPVRLITKFEAEPDRDL
jgi:hypothetical protein